MCKLIASYRFLATWVRLETYHRHNEQLDKISPFKEGIEMEANIF